jgi:hypothetical protein
MALDPRIILSIGEGIDQNRARNIQQQQADTNAIEAQLRAAELQQRMQEMRDAASRKNAPAAYDPQKAKQELEYRLLQGETVAHLLQQAKANPARYGAVRQSIGQLAGPEAMAHLPEEYDDATVTGMIDDGLAHIKEAKDNLQLVTHYDPETQTNVSEFVSPTAGLKFQQATPKAASEARPGTLEYYMTSTYGPNPTPEQQRQGRKEFNQSDDKATGFAAADVTKLSPAGIEIAALNYRKNGVMPPLGMGDKGNRQAIINRAATLTTADIARI